MTASVACLYSLYLIPSSSLLETHINGLLLLCSMFEASIFNSVDHLIAFVSWSIYVIVPFCANLKIELTKFLLSVAVVLILRVIFAHSVDGVQAISQSPCTILFLQHSSSIARTHSKSFSS